MSVRLESIKFKNPTTTLNGAASSMALCHAPPASLGFEGLVRAGKFSTPRLVGVSMRKRNVMSRRVFSFAASHEESMPSDIEEEKEDPEVEAQESEEAWQQALASFKEQALKALDTSKEAYELYSEKAFFILKETSEKLKIQAEKAREDLIEIAKETAEESKEYLATAAKNSPEPVMDIVETFKDVSESKGMNVRDFHVGIPYGALLSAGGFVSFMLTGSIPAIRFGIILGGTLLALSISSLKSWKMGEPSSLMLKGQTAIATVLFLREMRLLSMRPFVANYVTTIISGGVVVFYLYRLMRDREQRGGAEAGSS